MDLKKIAEEAGLDALALVAPIELTTLERFATVIQRKARDEALEEAIAECESVQRDVPESERWNAPFAYRISAEDCATAIRNLKGKP